MSFVPRVAIVGSGPAGMYAAGELLGNDDHPTLCVDLFERLPCPFGLVRGGVAPDHPRTRAVIGQFEQTLQHPRLRYFGNVTVNRDLSLDELRRLYHAVIIATGSDLPRKLGIPGENLPGVFPARSFAGWCCAHPDYADLPFNLDVESVVVIGHGNVALDVARLLCRTVDELRHEDIPESVLDLLATSRVRDVYLVGRGGPMEAKFTYPELREMLSLADCVPIVEQSDLPTGGELSQTTNRSRAWNMKTFREFATCVNVRQTGRRCHFKFKLNPVEFRGSDRVSAVDFATTAGSNFTLNAQIAFVGIGNLVSPWVGLPYDSDNGAHSSRGGLLLAGEFELAPVYATGWFHRTPSGLIGHNKADSEGMVERLFADISGEIARLGNREGGSVLLGRRAIFYITAQGWGRINELEQSEGRRNGKPRERFANKQFFSILSE